MGRRRVASRGARKAARPGEGRRAGEWIYNLGGWAIEQFADDPRPFTREELDKVAPNNPVLLQASYYEAYLNSRALQALGIDDKAPANDWVVRDSAGHPTGRITEAGLPRAGRASCPQRRRPAVEASTLGMIKDLNRAGPDRVRRRRVRRGSASACIRKWASEDKLNVRTLLHQRRRRRHLAGAGRARAAAHRPDEAVSGRQLRR